MFYVSTTFIKDGLSVNIAIRKLLKHNIKNIELGSNHCFEKKYSFLKKNNINYCVHNYFPIPKETFVVNIASQKKVIRYKSLKHIKKAIKFSKNIDAKLYTFHPGFVTDPEGSNISKKIMIFYGIKKLEISNYSKSWHLMIKSIKEIIKFAKKQGVKIAIESEGSVRSKKHLLMQRPVEFRKFYKIFNKKDIGINLNIGHLNLAANAFKFNKTRFIKNIKSKIIAMELSHNFGVKDDHLPLKKNSWYWSIIKDKKYDDIPKILEFRNTSIRKIISNYKLVQN